MLDFLKHLETKDNIKVTDLKLKIPVGSSFDCFHPAQLTSIARAKTKQETTAKFLLLGHIYFATGSFSFKQPVCVPSLEPGL